MSIDTLAERRQSIRSFKKKKVNWRKVLDAIDVALKGPYAGNYNNLKYIIVEDAGLIGEIAEACEQDWISRASIVVVVCADYTNPKNMYGARGERYARQQAGAAIQSILLKLAEERLGACWVGAFDDEKIKRSLLVPMRIEIEAVIPIGYADIVERKPRKAQLDEVLFWEKWGISRRPSLFEEKKEDNWTG